MSNRLGQGRHLPGRQFPGQDGERAPRDGNAAQPGHQPAAPGRPHEHRRRQPPPRPRPTAHAQATSSCMNTTLPDPCGPALAVHYPIAAKDLDLAITAAIPLTSSWASG